MTNMEIDQPPIHYTAGLEGIMKEFGVSLDEAFTIAMDDLKANMG